MFFKKTAVGRPAPTKNIFDEIDDEGGQQSSPADNGATTEQQQSGATTTEVDPLDAFMAGIETEIARDKAATDNQRRVSYGNDEEIMGDDDEETAVEAFERRKKEAGMSLGNTGGSDEDDADTGVLPEDEVLDRRKKAVDALPPVEHEGNEYPIVYRWPYKPHPEVTKMTEAEVRAFNKEKFISATGRAVPRAVATFEQCCPPLAVKEALKHAKFEKPTPIQCVAIPAALSGRDVLAIADTGSGKTLAYLMPLIMHIIYHKEHADLADRPAPTKDHPACPFALVLCPTRELAVQIEKTIYKLGKYIGITSTTLAGGLSKYEQFKDLRKGTCDIVVGNPGRCIDMVKEHGMSLTGDTAWVVLDEADRMLNMGFENQVRSLVQRVRPDRQTMLFSATMPPKIERLARYIMQDPVRLFVGASATTGGAAQAVTQDVVVVEEKDDKFNWLSENLPHILDDAQEEDGQVLIFVNQKSGASELAVAIREFMSLPCEALHGDSDQNDRMKIMADFRSRKTKVLVATDVASRGLDIPAVKEVICYDMSNTLTTHTHRLGRTGRAGHTGHATTLLVRKDNSAKMAAELVEFMEKSKQAVSSALMDFALEFPPFAAARELGHSAAKGLRRAAVAGGPQQRHGLGYSEARGTSMSSGVGKKFISSHSQEDTAKKAVVIGGDVDLNACDDDDIYAPGVKRAFGDRNVASRTVGLAQFPSLGKRGRDDGGREEHKDKRDRKSKWD
ncbi:RNA helicase-1, putative [Perkinsus marinus ATCC 50983]|uniref:RNA helicase n=1 Tax=Perkinsus marinus (strain ATCC 50983 / TXsc) TaxID=423536 RepID=C5K6D0_PERM5|nr:RNA helicase-1, putative [Perkinsus marinus ATCC 50983]EER19851.1 RNA helicase-1, putative [Perkinsus marinus ATCC 50983]|eukprot:XP_002788055.1 RNA helicase-1, putative [Perkinsus marinus ATCC 50983]